MGSNRKLHNIPAPSDSKGRTGRFEGLSLGIVVGPCSTIVIQSGVMERLVKMLGSLGVSVDIECVGGKEAAVATLPSEAIIELGRKGIDIAILLTAGENVKRSLYVGEEILENSTSKNPPDMALIQLLIVKEKLVSVVSWSSRIDPLANMLAQKLGVKLLRKTLKIRRFRVEGNTMYREILGVKSGETIYIDRVLLAKALSDKITLVERGGRLVDIIGARFDDAALKHIDLRKAIVKSM